MTAYGIAHLRTPQINDDVIDYIDRIQSTLDLYGGRFLVHGPPDVKVAEGSWPGTIVIISFPSTDHATAWYESAEYQEILPLRTDHIEGDVILVDGVPADYDPTRTAANLRASLPAR